MPVVIVKGTPGRVEEIFIASELIGHLATVYIYDERRVKEGTTTNQANVAGVSIGGALSGKLVRVVIQGIVSGVICASSVIPGDRIATACTSGTGLTSGTFASGCGKITPFNIITPVGAISQVTGTISQVSGLITQVTGTISQVSGLITQVTGSISQVSGLISQVTGLVSRVSGSLRIMSGGIISGLIVSSFTSGLIQIQGMNLITPWALVSGIDAFEGEVPTFTGNTPVFSGAIPVFTGATPVFSGAIPVFTGATPVFSGAVPEFTGGTPTFTGTAWNTGRVLGRALMSGGVGDGIRILVTLGG